MIVNFFGILSASLFSLFEAGEIFHQANDCEDAII